MEPSSKTMFEIYREGDYNRQYRSILYTELEEHARDREIGKAASGQTVLSGFLRDDAKEAGRMAIEGIVDELNELDEEDAPPAADALAQRLSVYLAE
ncbi:MAG: hypothetical protein GY946_30085 [bacterium]|nr:hypothetical protein [bacterium]